MAPVDKSSREDRQRKEAPYFMSPWIPDTTPMLTGIESNLNPRPRPSAGFPGLRGRTYHQGPQVSEDEEAVLGSCDGDSQSLQARQKPRRSTKKVTSLYTVPWWLQCG